MADSYVVHLAGGMYLDSSGALFNGVPDGAQVYQPPQGFHLYMDEVKDAFKFLFDILLNDEEDKKNGPGEAYPQKLWTFWPRSRVLPAYPIPPIRSFVCGN